MKALRAVLMALVGLFIGLAAGLLLPVQIPVAWSVYAAVLILCVLHALVRAVRDNLEDAFAAGEFVLGLLGNAVLALGLCVLGDRLAVPVYTAAIVYFGWGIFSDFASIRRHFTLQNGQNAAQMQEKNK